MINEILEFEAYVTAPDSDTPRLQPKMLTEDFGNASNLYGLEHILTIITRGFIFGDYFEKNIYSKDGMIKDNLIDSVKRVLFRWLGFQCARDYSADGDAYDKWNERYPQADAWLKKYYMKHCTKKDKSKLWEKIEDKWAKSLQGDDYRVSAVSINDVIANALELGALKEQCMIVKKASETVKSTKFKDRFKYLYCIDEKEGSNPQERTVEKLLKNIAVYLYLKDNHPENQKYVLLNRMQLLCWYGLDDNKNEARSWYLTKFLFDSGDNRIPIMTAISSDRGWNFIKIMIDNEFISKYDIRLIDVEKIGAINRDKYWIIKDNGHGVGSLCCVE